MIMEDFTADVKLTIELLQTYDQLKLSETEINVETQKRLFKFSTLLCDTIIARNGGAFADSTQDIVPLSIVSNDIDILQSLQRVVRLFLILSNKNEICRQKISDSILPKLSNTFKSTDILSKLFNGQPKFSEKALQLISSLLKLSCNLTIKNYSRMEHVYRLKLWQGVLQCLPMQSQSILETNDLSEDALLVLNYCLNSKAVFHSFIVDELALSTVFSVAGSSADALKVMHVSEPLIWIVERVKATKEFPSLLNPSHFLPSLLVAWLVLLEKQVDNEQYTYVESDMQIINNAFIANKYDVQVQVLFVKLIGSLSSFDSYHNLEEVIKRQITAFVLTQLSTDKAEVYLGYRSELMRVLANSCYKSKTIQNYIRNFKIDSKSNKNGLHLVLNASNIDSKNPHIREWCIFCIRNLCENNSLNQDAIRALRIQGVGSNSILEKAGLSLKLSKEGKPFVHKNREST